MSSVTERAIAALILAVVNSAANIVDEVVINSLCKCKTITASVRQ